MNCLSLNHSASRKVERLGAKLRSPFLAVGSRQGGAALLTGLIFLIILTLLGITAMQTSIMEERMSGNTRDRNIAFQAAEAALRDAELDIQCKKINGSLQTSPYIRAIGCISGMVGANATCTGGLCCVINNPALVCIEPSTPVYKNTSLSLSAAPSVEYGYYTRASAIPGVSRQPRYLIEPFRKQLVNYYRITARGYGVNSNTQVTLQEVYKE